MPEAQERGQSRPVEWATRDAPLSVAHTKQGAYIAARQAPCRREARAGQIACRRFPIWSECRPVRLRGLGVTKGCRVANKGISDCKVLTVGQPAKRKRLRTGSPLGPTHARQCRQVQRGGRWWAVPTRPAPPAGFDHRRWGRGRRFAPRWTHGCLAPIAYG